MLWSVDKPSPDHSRGRLSPRGVPIRLYLDRDTDHSQQDLLTDILKSRRDELGLKHREVATKANVSVSYVGMIERGERRPTPNRLRAILGALEIPTEDQGPGSVDFTYNDRRYSVFFKPPNLATRFRGPRSRHQDERIKEEQERLGALLRIFADNTAALEVNYAIHCGANLELPEESLPSPDAMLGELAQVLMSTPQLARRVYDQYFGKASEVIQGR